LSGIAARLDAQQLQQAITEPNAVIAEGFAVGLMPTDFANKMTVSELKMVVDLLLKQ
jgi:hypothetical protein